MAYNYLKNLFKDYSGQYSKTEKKIAKHFLYLGGELANKTLDQLSTEIEVSKTAIFDFVKKHGFDGFQNFKITIAQQQQHSREPSDELVVYSDFTNEDSPYVIAQKTIQASKILLDELLYSLSEETLNEAVETILSSEKLHFFGQGSSSIVAYDSYHKFIRTKFDCNYIQDNHMQISYSTKLDEDDCVFLFSHTGQSIETINIAKVLKDNKAKVIVLTGNPIGDLASYADVAFIVDTVEAHLGSEALSSRHLYHTIIDILYTSIMYNDEEKNKKSIAKIRKALSNSRLGE